jgi:hypothetical protein
MTLQKTLMQKIYGADIWAGLKSTHPPDLQGWNGDHPSLSRLAGGTGAKLVIDVGVWKGQSTINMALAMKKAGVDGCVIAVDHFLGSPEHFTGQFSTLFSRQHGLPDLYWIFLNNCLYAGVTDIVIPFPHTSVAAAQIFGALEISPSLVHVDAAHEYEEVIRDAEEYYALLQSGGYMIGDDYDLTWPGVVKAAGEFSARHGRPLTIEPPKWIVQKP